MRLDPRNYRKPCRHGVIPHVEVQPVEIGDAFSHTIPGRAELVYDCPTPYECADAAYREMSDS